MSLSPSQKHLIPKQILHVLQHHVADLSLVKDRIPEGFHHTYWRNNYICMVVPMSCLPMDKPWREGFEGGIRTNSSPEWIMIPLSKVKEDQTRELALAWRIPQTSLVAFYLAPSGLPDLINPNIRPNGYLKDEISRKYDETWGEWIEHTEGGLMEFQFDGPPNLFLLQGLLNDNYDIGNDKVRLGYFGLCGVKNQKVEQSKRQEFYQRTMLAPEHMEKIIRSSAILYSHQLHVQRGELQGSPDKSFSA